MPSITHRLAENESPTTWSFTPGFDSTGLTWALFFTSTSGASTYRSATVAGKDADEQIAIALDLAAVFDAGDDPDTAEAAPLPPGVYDIEAVAGYYEDGPNRPYPNRNSRILVEDYKAV